MKKKEEEKKKEDLQASVYRRLVTVAKHKGYTQSIPVFPRVRLISGAKENEPVMVVLTMRRIRVEVARSV